MYRCRVNPAARGIARPSARVCLVLCTLALFAYILHGVAHITILLYKIFACITLHTHIRVQTLRLPHSLQIAKTNVHMCALYESINKTFTMPHTRARKSHIPHSHSTYCYSVAANHGVPAGLGGAQSPTTLAARENRDSGRSFVARHCKRHAKRMSCACLVLLRFIYTPQACFTS